jgi:hypothetical protein
MPPQNEEWDKVILDIDPAVNPDICIDARKLETVPGGGFNAVYCSHNLEHYHEHEVKTVLRGFYHVLTDDGFVDVRVPDVLAVMRQVVEFTMDLDTVLYHSPAGPIRVCDVMWGWQKEIERSGQPFFAHKTGFSEHTLARALSRGGFRHIWLDSERYEIKALGFKQQPTQERLDSLGVVYEG